MQLFGKWVTFRNFQDRRDYFTRRLNSLMKGCNLITSMRAFIKMREMLASYEELNRKLATVICKLIKQGRSPIEELEHAI
jgi:hypothetical protein